MHVDLDRAPRLGDGLEQGLPEGIGAFRHAAFAMHAQGDAGDFRTFLQQDRQRVAAIGGAAHPVRLAVRTVQAVDHMVGMRDCRSIARHGSKGRAGNPAPAPRFRGR